MEKLLGKGNGVIEIIISNKGFSNNILIGRLSGLKTPIYFKISNSSGLLI